MSRSGYTDDTDDTGDILAIGRWRAQVASAIRGNRGQKFLHELAAAMDAMPEKVLIREELITTEGDCCALGVICKARGIDVRNVDELDSREVGGVVGIAWQLAAEIAYENDEREENRSPEARWIRMRAWVQRKLREKA